MENPYRSTDCDEPASSRSGRFSFAELIGYVGVGGLLGAVLSLLIFAGLRSTASWFVGANCGGWLGLFAYAIVYFMRCGFDRSD